MLESFPLRCGSLHKPSAPGASTVAASELTSCTADVASSAFGYLSLRSVDFNGISLGTDAQQLAEAAIAVGFPSSEEHSPDTRIVQL